MTLKFATWLKEKREEKEWTQRSLAKKLGGISHSKIADIENGKRLADANFVIAVAEVFYVDAVKLLKYAGPLGAESDDAPQLNHSLESELVQTFKGLDPDKQRELINYAVYLRDHTRSNPKS